MEAVFLSETRPHFKALTPLDWLDCFIANCFIGLDYDSKIFSICLYGFDQFVQFASL